MSESLKQEVQARRSPYESIRDSFPVGEDAQGNPTLGTRWRDADGWRAHLREQVASIEANRELSDEGRQAQIQQVYERIGGRIERESKQAREIAQKNAEAARERAIPGVRDQRIQNDPTTQTNVLLLASELRDRVKHIRDSTPKGLSADARVSEMLRSEYAKAAEAGGLSGATSCAAVLRAAQSIGVDPEDIYSDMRTEEHNRALDELYTYERAANMIPTDVPSVNRGVSYGNHWRSGASPRAAVPRGGAIAGARDKKRRPPWK